MLVERWAKVGNSGYALLLFSEFSKKSAYCENKLWTSKEKPEKKPISYKAPPLNQLWWCFNSYENLFGFFFSKKKEIWIFADSMWFPLLFLFQKVICGLNNKIYEHTVEGKKDKETKVEQVAQYMEARIKGTRDHNSWARKFFFCECLNFFNVILQIILTDKFLGGEFSTYGTEVLINENFSVTNFLKNRPSWQHWHY